MKDLLQIYLEMVRMYHNASDHGRKQLIDRIQFIEDLIKKEHEKSWET